jgi:hypothetical protein
MPASRLLQHLRQVRKLQFSARSEMATGWAGQGSGTVRVESPPLADAVVFHESGRWQPAGREAAADLAFRNVYRWSLVDARTVRLEHLRFGPARPVFLLDLSLAADGVWHAPQPHLCADDTYALRLTVVPDGAHAAWAVRGPRKDETLAYAYAF